MRNLTAITINSTNIDVYWDPPIITQGPIVRYELVSYLDTNGQQQFYQFTDNFASFGANANSGPLIPNHLYNFEVAAVSDYGRGPYARAYNLTLQDGLLKGVLILIILFSCHHNINYNVC